MLDTIFEKGLYDFISLTIATCLICAVLTRIFIKDIERHDRKRGIRPGESRYLYNTVRILIWATGASLILGQIKPPTSRRANRP